MSAADSAMRDWAADWGLGGAVNALEDIEKLHGITDTKAHVAGLAITAALRSLGLASGSTYRAPDVWRAEP
ncbi:hypothetical protein V3C33_13780 [Micrococcaceae bacterium Sec5.7]